MSAEPLFSIGERMVGGGRCYVIAEAGVNHNGDPAMAHELVDAAAATGADAVKFQAFRSGALASPSAGLAAYQSRDDGVSTQLEMLRRLELPDSVFAELAEHAAASRVAFLCTPFDHESLVMLAALRVPAMKLSSGDLTNLPLVSSAAALGLPLLMSTGMADLTEVREAVDAAQAQGAVALALLQCVSAYPAPPSAANLRAMRTMRDVFGLPVGFSDHTVGTHVAVAAAALGAALIEKHLTLDRALEGPDHAASLEPAAFTTMVLHIREAEDALGDGVKRPHPSEAQVASVARRSVVATRDLPAGGDLSERDLDIRRPGTGIPPKHLAQLIGRRLSRAVPSGQPLRWEDLA